MSDLLFGEVKQAVVQWISDNKEKFKCARITIEIVENSDERLYAVLSLSECMAAIVVAEADFAPYRFVSFEAVGAIDGNPNMVCSWYDDENTNVEEVVANLDSALDTTIKHDAKKMP